MRTLLFALLLGIPVLVAFPQQAGDPPESRPEAAEASQPEPEQPDPEEQALRRGVREANGSQVDIQRALENHLAQFPESKRREEIEYVLLKTATDLGDDARVLKYGMLFLDTGANDATVFDRVIPLMLRDESEAVATKALAYAKRYEIAAACESIDDNKPAAAGLAYSWKRQRDRAFARAYVFQARALGNLGSYEEALKLARRSFEIEPSAEAARELGRVLAKMDRVDDAVNAYAEAFAIDDPRNDAAHRGGTAAGWATFPSPTRTARNRVWATASWPCV